MDSRTYRIGRFWVTRVTEPNDLAKKKDPRDENQEEENNNKVANNLVGKAKKMTMSETIKQQNSSNICNILN